MTATMRPERLSTHEVCRRAGITYRVLDYWSRTDTLRATHEAAGSGTRRRWSLDDLAVAGALKVLAAHHAETEVLREVAITLREWLDAGQFRGVAYVDLQGRVSRTPGAAAWVLDLDSTVGRDEGPTPADGSSPRGPSR